MTSIESSKGDNFEDFISPSLDTKCFVDVGGYDGDTVTKALQISPNLKIVVIEPIKHLCDTIKQKFINNPNVIVVNKAAWNKKCDVEFNEYDGWAKGLSTIQSTMTQLRPYPQFTNNISKYNIKADTLDNILSELNIPVVDYLKVDTEGSEEQVLQGFTKYHNGTRFHIEHHITNLANILDKLLVMGTDIEKVTVFRDCNIKEHVVGAVIGKFVIADKDNSTNTNQTKYIESRNQWILDHCKVGERIIDIGSQDGHIFADTPFAPYVTSIDIDKYDFPGFVRMDAHELKFPDKSFDIAILAEILEHVISPIQVLKEAKRVSRRILITVPNEYEWDKSLVPFKDIEEESKARNVSIKQMAREGNPKAVEFYDEDNYKHLWHCRYYTEDRLREDLEKANIKDYNLEKLNYGGWSFFTVDTGSKESKIAKMIEEIKKRKATSIIQKIDNNKTENKEKQIAYEPANPEIKLDIPKGPIITFGTGVGINSQLPSKGKLRIALIGSSFFTIPPKGYSGLEMVLWDLAEGLDELGHIVTIFANEGSKVPQHGALFVTGPEISTVNVDWFKEEEKRYFKWRDVIVSDRYDLVCGMNWFGFEYLQRMNNLKLNVAHVHHGSFIWQTAPPFPKPNLIAISKFMRDYTIANFKQKGFNLDCRYVYNGIDLSRYTFDPTIKKTNRLLYVGRFSNFKGPDKAIEIAKKIGLPIDLIGGSFVDDPNYMKQIESMCDGKDITINKDVSHEFKIRKMQEAKAILVPSRMNEPFNLVSIESQACGTAVIVTRDGGLPETVSHGVTGFVCDTEEQMIEAVGKVDSIKSTDCRKWIEENFSRQRMAIEYEKLFYQIVRGENW
jgi:FkbM family methyltransferase